METKNNQLSKASHGGAEIKTLQQFTDICESECNLRIQNLVEEFKGRKEQLLRIKETRLNEYKFMHGIIAINTMMNNNNVDPAALMQVERELANLTYDGAMNSQPMSYWQKEFGDSFIIPIVSDLLNYFLRQFTVKESLSGIQIMQLAARLITAQPHLRIKELVMLMNNALSGKYGPTYQRIGIETVMEWLTKYYEDSSKAIECKVVNSKQDESRGEQPWQVVEKDLKRYKEEQEAKKAIAEKVWGIEKRKREVVEYKESLTEEKRA